nr:hypothetical protein [uncultured Roseateles sp.]
MQTTPAHLIPDWIYQAPRPPASYPDQLYYRAGLYHEIGTSYPPQRAPHPALSILRFSHSTVVKLKVGTGCGEAEVNLDDISLLALRDACNDALQDIAQAEIDLCRRDDPDGAIVKPELAAAGGQS